MYAVTVIHDFTARHFLSEGPEEERAPHAHEYRVEVEVRGPQLNHVGYLIDISEIEQSMADVLETYGRRLLNDVSNFAGLNPSIEHLSRVIWTDMCRKVTLRGIAAMRVKVWESSSAAAWYEEEMT